MTQVFHTFDTNITKNLNHVVAYLHLSGSFNVHTRVSIAVDTPILGHLAFWIKVLSGYGTTPSPSLSTLLAMKDKTRERQKKESSKRESKLKRTDAL